MWLSSIQEFADADTQRRLWLDPTNTNPHFSFGEYYCCYFDDLNLTDGGYEGAIEEGLVSAEEVEAVREFHRITRAYHSPASDYDYETILADPKWAEVVRAAQRAQAALLALIDDPCERLLLTEP
jgi:hypothetical protein